MAPQDGSERPGVNAPALSWLELAQLIAPEVKLELELEKAAQHYQAHPWKRDFLPLCERLALLAVGDKKKQPINPDNGRFLKGWPEASYSVDELSRPSENVQALSFRPGPDSDYTLTLDLDGQLTLDHCSKHNCKEEEVGWITGRSDVSDRKKMHFYIPPELRGLLLKENGEPIGHRTKTLKKGNKKTGEKGQQIELFYGQGHCLIAGKHPEKKGAIYVNQGSPSTVCAPSPHWWALILQVVAHKPLGKKGRQHVPQVSELQAQWDRFRWSDAEKAAATGSLAPSFTADDLLELVSRRSRDLIEKGSDSGSRWEDGTALTLDLRGIFNLFAELSLDLTPQVERLLDRFVEASGGDVDKERLANQYHQAGEDVMPSRSVLDFMHQLHCLTQGQLGQRKDQRQVMTEGRGGLDALLEDIGPGEWRENEDGARVPPPKINVDGMAELVEYRLRPNLRFNELSQQVEYGGKSLRPDELELIYVDLNRQDRYVSQKIAIDVLVREARRYRFDPLADYLKALENDPAVIPVDINRLAKTYLGTEDPLYDQMLRVALLGAVARRLDPGCIFQSVVVLKGRQGIKKSTFWQALAGPGACTSSVPDDDKDLLLTLHSTWLFELAELESITDRRSVGKLKNLISTSVDTLRVPYGRAPEKRPRASIFVGSVNGDSFLRDETGERRYLVIECPQDPARGESIDVEAVLRDRDRIWKAVVLDYRQEGRLYLDQAQQVESNARNLDYQEKHAWEGPLDEWLQNGRLEYFKGPECDWRHGPPDVFTVAQALVGCGVRDLKHLTKQDEQQMGRLLRARGFERVRQQVNRTKTYFWRRKAS